MNLSEIKQHNKRNDLYVIIHNKVYDVTAFLSEHPGGEDVLVDEGGGDATEAFEDIGHSDDARQVLQKYFVGDLDEKSAIKAKLPEPPAQLHTPSGRAGSNYSTLTGAAIPLLVLLVSIISVKYLYSQ